MKRKLIVIMFAVTASACACGLLACGGGNGDGGEGQTPPHVHTYIDSVVAPTCTERGYTLHTCECGESYTDGYTAASGHTPEIDQAVEATCITTGLTQGSHCSVCGTHLVEQQPIEKTEHNYVNYVCTVCDDEISKNDLQFDLSDDGTYYSVICGTSPADEVFIPSEFNGLPVRIGARAFSGSTVKSVRMGGDVAYIGAEAFAYSELSEVTIGAGVTEIGANAFSYCPDLLEAVIPASVTVIGSGAFSHCRGLERLAVASGNRHYSSEGNCLLTRDGKTLIAGCKMSVIPAGVTAIGNGAFEGCATLTGISIPSGVNSIGIEAFMQSGITGIVIPEGVTRIEARAFAYCPELVTITLPESISMFGERAFYNCNLLNAVRYGGTQSDWCERSEERRVGKECRL